MVIHVIVDLGQRLPSEAIAFALRSAARPEVMHVEVPDDDVGPPPGGVYDVAVIGDTRRQTAPARVTVRVDLDTTPEEDLLLVTTVLQVMSGVREGQQRGGSPLVS